MKHWDVLSPIFIQHGAIYGSPSSSCVLSVLVLLVYLNKELMRVFRGLDMVEQLGSGIPQILAPYSLSFSF
jgi:hypothetical protein